MAVRLGDGEVMVVVVVVVIRLWWEERQQTRQAAAPTVLFLSRENHGGLRSLGDVKEDKLLLKKILIVFCGCNKSGSGKTQTQ